jgi:hypothetical protein
MGIVTLTKASQLIHWGEMTEWLCENIGTRGISWDSLLMEGPVRMIVMFERTEDQTMFTLRWG